MRNLLIAGCCILGALVQAADAPVPPGASALTLSAALAQAYQLNETRDVAAARIQHALALRRQALALLLPSLSAGASIQKSSVSHQPFAGNVSRQDGAQLAVDLTLFNAGSYKAVSAANVAITAQELDSSDLRRLLAFQVAIGFVNVIAVEHQLIAAERRRDVAAETAAQTRARVEAGVATSNDATRSDLELATAELTITNNRQAVLAARLSLGDLVGREVTGLLEEPQPTALPSRELAELETLALRERPDLQSGVLRIRANALQAESVRFGIIPTIGVHGSYLLSNDDPDSGYTTSPQWQVALGATWELYNGGAREATADALDADRREAVANLSTLRRGVHRDLATVLGGLDAAELALTQAQRQLEVAHINATEVQARFGQGLATALAAADANASVFQAESNLASRHFDVQASRFQLRQLIGVWPVSAKAEEPAAGMKD